VQRLSFKESLTKGIRPDGRVPVNAQYLLDAKNLSCTPFGAKAMRSFQQPITDAALTSASVTKAYPFPQLFVGKSVTLLADATAIFDVTKSDSGNWTLTAATIYSWEDFNDDGSLNAVTIPTGKEWHFVDLHGDWMLFNGECVVFTFSGVTFVQSSVTIQTGAVYNDAQIVFGGFDSSDLFSLADWPTYLATYQTHVPAGLPVDTYGTGMGGSHVWWSSVAGEDKLRFFSLPVMKYGLTGVAGVFTDANPYWLQFAQRGESAGAPMPYTGTVQRMMQCGNVMMVYASNGVRMITPDGDGKLSGVQELPGFAPNVGLCSGTTVRLAVGGNENIQAFIDERRDLWVVEGGGGLPKATNLGYRNVFASATNIMVHYDAGENEFYFTGDSDFAYRLPIGGGMSKAPMLPTTVAYGRANNVSGPVGIRTLVSDPTTAYLQTNWFDNQGRNVVSNAMRIIVQVDAEDTTTGLQAALVYKRFPNDPNPGTTGYVTVDNRGVAKIAPTSYYMAYIQITHPDRTTININDIILEFDDGERRSVVTCLP